jgi:hypothetical protein
MAYRQPDSRASLANRGGTGRLTTAGQWLQVFAVLALIAAIGIGIALIAHRDSTCLFGSCSGSTHPFVGLGISTIVGGIFWSLFVGTIGGTAKAVDEIRATQRWQAQVRYQAVQQPTSASPVTAVQAQTDNKPAPGWFPDPQGGPGTRLWNCDEWTSHVRPA